MTKSKWTALLVIVGIIDAIQWFIIELVLVWFFGAGIAINEILDPIVGGLIGIYLQKNHVEVLRNVKRLMWLMGTEAAAALTGGFVQTWIIAVWYIKKDYEREEAAIAEAGADRAQLESNAASVKYYAEGVGRPRKEVGEDTRKLYSGGIGRPRGRDPLPMQDMKPSNIVAVDFNRESPPEEGGDMQKAA
ncbi:MAG: hypothetical protein V4481_02355 [Patescibacteria group bacterium]